ncbi:hypothetical protein FE257_004673 [Aspergillus nanangensis]|uniref:HbrB-like protein n=1 Tax=Aspergillus nanangensis TaxID=2582783 RepID=A0AAD4GZR8_ASPNN|nr:hypothetical protein FE257_004673 [Aspergillus nanangensis]
MLRSPVSPERRTSYFTITSPLPPRQSLDEDDDELEQPDSSDSDASSIASVTTISAIPPPLQISKTSDSGTASPRRPPRISSINTTTTPPLPSNRPSASSMPHNDISSRRPSGRSHPSDLQKHRSRHHSQGFFEPSLPTASITESTLSASRIAAQAAMQHQSMTQIPPKRSHTVIHSPDPTSRAKRGGSISPPPPPPSAAHSASGVSVGQPYHNGGHAHVATTAANLVFPRQPTLQPPGLEPPSEREHKPKGEKSKMKLFSKPKHIGISRDKDPLKDRGLPSPSKMGFSGSSGLSRIVSASTTSLADTFPSNNSSMYNLSNASATTVVPADKPAVGEKEKDKSHKHHFLSRQKLKLKDHNDHYNLPLSSASSNSKPSDPNAPQSLYSFTPASPGAVTTTFGKSVSGLDLLHGGRALREKKKEEKALAESEQNEYATGTVGTPAVFPGPSSAGSTGLLAEAALKETLQGFGLNNMTPEDAWDFLKAKLLVIFDDGDVRISIEDLNKLVLIHIQRCVQKRTPTAIVNDLRELLETGCASFNHMLSGVPDEKLVPPLVNIWRLVFGKVLPFIQAVFLPLDLEFRGVGSVMNLREANEFWESALEGEYPGCELEVRNLVLVAFRDKVILHRYDGLKATFSRLSLDNIDLANSGLSVTTKSSTNGGRPTTAASLDPGFGSYGSQSSTLLNTAAGSNSSDSLSNRSRAASNTSSNPDQPIFQSLSSPAQRPTIIHRSSNAADTSHVITETVGRMLQCVSVLGSVQTGDRPQEKIEGLGKALKHNWLGRGRTGRDRRGFVGAKIRPAIASRTESDESTKHIRDGDMDRNFRDGRQELSVL